jgi:hypothetical protein
VTTFTDGAPPSVTPEPDDGSVPHRAEAPDPDPDTGSAWLHDEIQRRIAEKAAAGGGGRHARRGEPASSSSAEYIARHSVATPGPGAPRPGPVGGQMSQASELLRRERIESTTAQPVWSGPPIRAVEGPSGGQADDAAAQPAPGPPDRAAGAGAVRPGVAAAAAMRGAARGRALKAAASATPPTTPMPPLDAAAPAPPRPGPAAPTGAPPDPSTTGPVETAPVEVPPVEPAGARTAPVEATPPAAAGPPVPNPAAPGAVPTGPLPAPPPGEAVAPPPPPAVAPDPVAAELTAPVPPVPPAPEVQEPADGPAPAGPPPGGITVPEQRGAERRRSRPDDTTNQAGKRVRVVLAERKSVARPVRTVITIQESSGVGELLRTNLIGSQLAIALRFAIGAGLTLGLLPLLFAMVPEIGRVEVLGIRLPWLLLGVLVYPFLFGLGLWHTRTAEHLEQNFAETVQD